MPAAALRAKMLSDACAKLASRIEAGDIDTSCWKHFADAVADAIHAVDPAYGFAAMERPNGSMTLAVVASRNLPMLKEGHREQLSYVPLFASALANPGRICLGPAAAGRQLACLAFPAGRDPMRVMVVSGPGSGPDGDAVRALMASLRSVMVPVVRAFGSVAKGDRVSAAIRRAKREWESTADALPAVIGLADGHGVVLRINRAVSRSLGIGIADALHRPLHELLHAGCVDPVCPHAARLETARQDVLAGEPVDFGFSDLERGIDWKIRLRLADDLGDDEPRIVFSCIDVTQEELARRELLALHGELEARVQQRTAELEESNRRLFKEVGARKASEDALRRSRAELESLLDWHDVSVEELSRGLAGELYQNIGQSLAAIKYNVETAMERASTQERPADPSLERAVGLVQSLLEQLRQITRRLRPSELDSLGISAALRSLGNESLYADAGMRVEVESDVNDATVPRDLSTTLYRTAQEAIRNVAQHSGASNVRISLSAEGPEIHLQVEDDGVGFNPQLPPRPAAWGLKVIRERVERSRGRFRLMSEPGRGTAIRASWGLQGRAMM